MIVLINLLLEEQKKILVNNIIKKIKNKLKNKGKNIINKIKIKYSKLLNVQYVNNKYLNAVY